MQQAEVVFTAILGGPSVNNSNNNGINSDAGGTLRRVARKGNRVIVALEHCLVKLPEDNYRVIANGSMSHLPKPAKFQVCIA